MLNYDGKDGEEEIGKRCLGIGKSGERKKEAIPTRTAGSLVESVEEVWMEGELCLRVIYCCCGVMGEMMGMVDIRPLSCREPTR